MTCLQQIALPIEPVGSDVKGGVVYDRFQAEPDLMAIAVVDDQGVPVGLVERNHFALKMASNYGRALYAGRPVALIMDPAPLIADQATLVSDFSGEALASRPSDLLKGIIVVSEGRYVGVATIIALMKVITQQSQDHAQQLATAAVGLSAAKAEAQSANLLLKEALDAMSEAVAIFDENDACVLWNSKYAQSFGDERGVLRPGVTLETLLRQSLARGQVVDAQGREDAWLADRLQRRAAMVHRISEEQALADNRFIRVEDTRLATGGSINVAVDVTDLKRREDSFRFLFENNPVALAVFDQATRQVLAVNAAAARQYGYSSDALEQMSVLDLVDEEDREAAAQALEARMAGGYTELDSSGRRWSHRTASGEPLKIRAFMRPLTYQGRAAVLVAALDVTAQHQAEASLKAAVALAEAANGAKSEFLANMSHEIRTPLNGMLGVAGVLAQTKLTAPQHEMVGIIETSAKTLQALLADILDIAKIEAGRLDLQENTVDPAELAIQVSTLFAATAAEKGLRFDLTLDDEARRPVIADSTRLAQIITNLCSNAIKFTERGGVTLSVSSQTTDLGQALTIAVRDTGIGISAAAREKLFERFSQADGSITRRFGGTGLGLAISQQLAHRMGGQIEVDSEEGVGSTFALTVTLALAEPQAAAPVAADAQAPAGQTVNNERPLRVLLVEDHPVNRKVIDLMIGQLVDLTMAEDGAKGVAAAAGGAFDLILMDMQMPVMDGLTATRAIRRREAEIGAPPVPIIVLTANVLPEHVQACLEAGADSHLAKPVSAPALLAAMQQALTPTIEPQMAMSA